MTQFLLISPIRQHAFDTLLVALSDYTVNIQQALSLVSLLGQDVTRMRMSALNLASGSQAKTFRRAFVCF